MERVQMISLDARKTSPPFGHAGTAAGGSPNLLFDPVLVYSTFLGRSNSVPGGGGQGAYILFVDSAGNVYVGGTTDATDFPVTSGAMQSSNPHPQSGGTTVGTPAGTYNLVVTATSGGTTQTQNLTLIVQ